MTTTQKRRPVDSGAAEPSFEMVDETVSSVQRPASVLTAGDTMRAADALRGGQETFTREHVAYLTHLAYESGRHSAFREDLAELQEVWASRAERRRTYEERVRGRVVDMEGYAARLAVRMLETHGRTPWSYQGGPVDWETGRPLRSASGETGVAA